MNRLLVVAVSASFVAGAAQFSLAQEGNLPATPAKSPRPTKSRMIEEVMVTARRTEESQQTVPVAVSALSADSLQRESITNLQDIQGRIPSLSITGNSQQRSTEAPTLRGQGGTFGSNPGVVLYYAEVPVPNDFPFNGQGGPGKFFDVANLQVLKGSQGTLFGRNTTGGAMLVEPRKPENTFSAELTAAASNFNGKTLEGIINIPLIDDTLLMRAGVSAVTRDGFTYDEAHDIWLDDKDYLTARFSLQWNITERLDNYFLSYYTHTDTSGTGIIIEDINQDGLNNGLPSTIVNLLGLSTGPVWDLLITLGIDPINVTNTVPVGCLAFNVLSGSINCGENIEEEQHARGIRRNETSLKPSDEIEVVSLIDHINYALTDNITLRNIFSYSTMWHIFNWDADGSRFGFQDLSTPEGYKSYDVSQITEELQLQGVALGDRLTYVVGAYYQSVDPEGPQGQQIIAFGLDQPTNVFAIEQETYAPYAQGSYDLGGIFSSLEGLSLTLGARYTTDKVHGLSEVDGDRQIADLKYSALTYTAGLDYTIGDNLLYAKVSKGYKAGGFSPTATLPENFTYDPEYVLTYEIGQKSDFFIGEAPLRINTAIYHTSYDDMQRTGIDTNGTKIGAAIFKAGRAEIAGFEFEGLYEPFEWLRLSLNYAYTHAEYKEFLLPNKSANLQRDCSGEYITQGNTAELSCVPFQYTPKHQYSISPTLVLPVPMEYGLATASLTYAWVDEQYSSAYTLPSEEPGAWLESFGLVNGSLSWMGVMGSNFDLSIFGTNLTDEKYRISNSNTWNLVYYQSSIYGEPRVYGARLNYRWGEH